MAVQSYVPHKYHFARSLTIRRPRRSCRRRRARRLRAGGNFQGPPVGPSSPGPAHLRTAEIDEPVGACLAHASPAGASTPTQAWRRSAREGRRLDGRRQAAAGGRPARSPQFRPPSSRRSAPSRKAATSERATTSQGVPRRTWHRAMPVICRAFESRTFKRA